MKQIIMNVNVNMPIHEMHAVANAFDFVCPDFGKFYAYNGYEYSYRDKRRLC